jgi:1-acyl-sn-glycerol-3-phosphate acyltransferase
VTQPRASRAGEATASAFAAALIIGFARLVTGVRARWIGCAPAPAQRIYFANHSSHGDFVLLWSALPPALRARTRPVAGADYWLAGRLRRWLIEAVFRGVMVERGGAARGDADPLAPLLQALDQGDSLIIFPEGTRNAAEVMLPFKSGLYHLARQRPAVELVPVWLENLNRVMPKGEVLPVPLLCSVSLGAPMRLEAGEDKQAFLDRARQRIIDLQTP